MASLNIETLVATDFPRDPLGIDQCDKAHDVVKASIRECRLVDLVSGDGVSVRLVNALRSATNARTLPFTTVGGFLDAGSQATPILLQRVQNFGRKTARELEALVVAALAGAPPTHTQTEEPTSDPAEVRRCADLISLFDGETIGSIVEEEIISVRLGHVLYRGNFHEMPFGYVLGSLSHVTVQILRVPHCGRKTAEEFRQLCIRHVARRLAEAGVSPAERDADVTLILYGTAKSRTPLEDDATGILNGIGSHNAPDMPLLATTDNVHQVLAVPDHSTLRARLEWLLDELAPRQAEIVRRRCGIGQDSAETLEEIGSAQGVTRERIRQIEAKALKRMRIRARRASIEGLLADATTAEWRNLSGGRQILLQSDLYERRRRVDPYIVLALDIMERSLTDWLNTVAMRFVFGWHAPGGDGPLLEATARRIEAGIANMPIPRAIVDFGVDIDTDVATISCELILGRPVRLGYVMPFRVGLRLSRLIGLHAILAQHVETMVTERLLSEYHPRFPLDPCSERDAEIVMNAASHLFLEVEDGHWTAIGTGGQVPPPSAQFIPIKQQPEDEGTIAHALQVTLRERGPTRLGDLLDSADAILPEGRSINSIGPVLLTRRELFVRALPGVYALPEQIPDGNAEQPENIPILLNETQARLYAIARHAGEPRHIFPFWTIQAEFQLVRWARHSAGAATFHSLLAVAAIDDWPVGAVDRENWYHLQARQGGFELGATLRRDAAYERPDLDHVLSACLYARSAGSFNWVAANRLTARKIDAHGGAGVVALLVKLGALEEPLRNGFRWQMPHTTTALAHEIAISLSRTLAETGVLDWESEVGRDLAHRVHRHADGPSWVDSAAVAAMVGRPPAAHFEEGDETDPVAALMAQHRRTRDAERREAALKWLLEE